MPDVTIGGTEPEAIIDVSTGDGSSSNLGSATITVGATPTNKQFGSGELLRVERNGDPDFLGYTTARPARTNQGTLAIEALDTRYELKNESVNRVFYNMDTGAIVRELVARRATALGQRTVHRGSSSSGWSSDAPHFSLGNIDTQHLFEFGSDFLFVGFPESSTGTYRVTYSGVPNDAIPGDGQLLSFGTRLLVNDPGDQITTTIELCDNAGNNYVWRDVDTSTRFSTPTLAAEDANADGSVGNGTLEYRFEITGALSDDTGIAIDNATTTPFALHARQTDLSTNHVQETGRTITRRVEKGALELLNDFEIEDGYLSYVDSGNDLHYEPSGERAGGLAIVRGETPVTAASFGTDYDTVRNKVVVQGVDGVQVTRRDPASIRYYGLAARTEPIVDREIQTDAEAADRADGYLDQHAWTDTVATFEIADTAFKRARQGMGVRVEWPPQGLSGVYKIQSKTIDSAGVVTLNIGAQV